MYWRSTEGSEEDEQNEDDDINFTLRLLIQHAVSIQYIC